MNHEVFVSQIQSEPSRWLFLEFNFSAGFLKQLTVLSVVAEGSEPLQAVRQELPLHEPEEL